MDDADALAPRGGRARSACDLCRHKKIRCDGEKPACENCHFAGVVCTFTFTGQPRKTIREQLSEAKARVRELEEFIAARDLSLSSSPLRDELQSHVSSSPCPPLSLSSAPSHPQDSSVFDTALEIFQQHLEWSWPGVAHSPQRSSFYATIYRQTGTILDMSGFWARVSDSYKSQYPATQPKTTSPKWPSYQLVQQCLNYYSANGLYAVFPIIDVAAAQAIITDHVSGRADARPLAEKACLFALTAFVTKLHHHQPMFADTDSDGYVQAVLTLVPKLMLEPNDVRKLEAFLIIALHIAPAGKPEQSQLFLSMAIRILYHLGAHRKSPLIPNDESHTHLRAMFWLCYTMDKEMSIRSCLPPLLQDVDCDLNFPPTYVESFDLQFLPTTPSTPHLLLPTDIRVAMLKSKVYHGLYSCQAQKFPEARRLEHIRQLDQELSDLKASFPVGFRPDSYSPGGTERSHSPVNVHNLGLRGINIHLEYYYCLRKLHEASFTGSLSMPLPSSLELYYQASRSTLLYYLRASGLVDRFSFWIHAQFILSSILSLFWCLIDVPTASTFSRDLRILQDTKDLFASFQGNMNGHTHTSDEQFFPPAYIMHEFLELLISLARQVLARTKDG
ncbi:hypothetical protein BO94DRAFT_625562 [Aspergillus sclerotioniger CBS 115572]|uniref:Zn(2)-C6 fungal-type domain-containing protein n=1 Tax=Aspergillus sclerotioniger CBS 115572 TaxID=1450535 RepID=A0A317WG83_9EURO|nr:hypothetical protein BO94DRAFT_625562 [Aspergillus sclerotioniger CBS 115572]PWY83190.1 hypothetical protein BO94DRAFT_625562 [Aspergillus sclerotioniger CBS 115572]